MEDEKKDIKIQSNLSLFVIGLVAFFISVITIQFLWNWFIAPIGLKELSYAHSSGIVLIMIWLSNSKEEPTYNEFTAHIIKSIIVLAIGYIIVNIM